MTAGVNTVIFPVKDLARTKLLYGALPRVEPATDSPSYVGFAVARKAVGLDPNGHGKGMTGPVSYWRVDDIGGGLQALLNAGAETRQAVKDIDGGKLIASVTDADGNLIGLVQSA